MSLKKSILIVEDDDAVRTSISEVLLRDGWDVIQAADGIKAVDFYMACPTDVVLVDLMLPGIDGMEFMMRLREISKDVMFVVHTGYANRLNYYHALRAGITEFIAKPCDMEKLKKVLGDVVEFRIHKKQLRNLPGSKYGEDHENMPM